MCVRGEASSARLRTAVQCADLLSTGMCIGSWLNEAVTPRSAAPLSVAFFAERRVSEIAALRAADVGINESAGTVEVEFRCQENDQLGVGQLAHMVSLPSRKGACPVHLLSGWL